MTTFDLFLIFSVFVIFLALLGMLIALVTHRWVHLKRLALAVLIYLSMYALLLVGFALLSHQKVLAMHQLRCFDDWCTQTNHHPARVSLKNHRFFNGSSGFFVKMPCNSKRPRLLVL